MSDSEDRDAKFGSILALLHETPSQAVQRRLQDSMRRHWESLGGVSPPVRRTWRLTSWQFRTAAALGLAVSVAIAVMLMFGPASGTRSLYAQAMAAVRAARTVHVTAIEVSEGRQMGSAEIWYSANRGVREDFGNEGVRLDDGEFEWTYRPATQTLIKGPSRDPVGMIEELLRPVEAIGRLDARRDRTLDATVDQSECRAFVAARQGGNSATRYVLWLDDRDRLIRFEQEWMVGGAWALNERIDIRYDVPIPEERFAAAFPPDVRIIDRTTPLQGFELEKALATAERLGIVLAIHDVRRVDDNTVFVMSTSRASQQVSERLGKIDSRRVGASKVYGEFVWSTNGRRLPDQTWREGMQPVTLASWQRDGIDYQWVLLRNTRTWTDDDGRLPVGFSVYARNEWQEALESAGKPWFLWSELDVLLLDVPAESEGLDAILAEVYRQTLTMGDSTRAGAPRLHLKSIPFTSEMIEDAVASGTPRAEAERCLQGRSSAPENITLDLWRQEMAMVLGQTDGRSAGARGSP